jgi:hypothetical protein
MSQEKKECADCCGWAEPGNDRCGYHQCKPAAATPAQSELLTKFYRAYAAWIDDGAPEILVFTRQHGLCHNLKTWLRAVDGVVIPQTWYELDQEMRKQFRQARLHETFPFNRGDRMYYQIEQNTVASGPQCHSNANRLSWVNEHAQ